MTSPFSWSGTGSAIFARDRVRGSDLGTAASSRRARGATVRRLLAVRTGSAETRLISIDLRFEESTLEALTFRLCTIARTLAQDRSCHDTR